MNMIERIIICMMIILLFIFTLSVKLNLDETNERLDNIGDSELDRWMLHYCNFHNTSPFDNYEAYCTYHYRDYSGERNRTF